MSLRDRYHASLARVDRVATPVVVFLLVYVAILVLPALTAPSAAQPLVQWFALIAVIAATLAGRIAARDTLPLGLRLDGAPGGFARGASIAVAVVGSAHLILAGSGHIVTRSGNGFPAAEVAVLFVPAVLHEELLFRGWAFQHLARWNRSAALLLTSALFAALHLGNPGITALALLNILLAGLILGLACLAYRSLWLPIAAHLVWNLLTGPVFGYEVSGHRPERSLLVAVDSGPELLTGGEFGLEASVVMTVTEFAGLVLLAVIVRRRGRETSSPAKIPAS